MTLPSPSAEKQEKLATVLKKLSRWKKQDVHCVIGAPAGPGALADTVVVSSAKVPNPVAVRYAWANWHPWANLFNNDGLPALPFRTDDWIVKQIQLQAK